MTAQLSAEVLPPTGVVGVTRLTPVPPERAELFGAVVDLSQAALELGTELPATPELRLVGGPPSPVKAWAARFAQALVEVMAGDRGAHQLLRCTTPDVHARIAERSNALNTVARPTQRRTRVRTHVRSIHCFQPDPATAEVSVHVCHGERSRALAVRVERRSGRWVCTAVEFG